MKPSYVVGVGETEYSRASGRTEPDLAAEAIRRALADAGLGTEDVDGMVRFSQDPTAPGRLVDRMSLEPLRFTGDDNNGGRSACAILGLADAAIARGRARVVVLYRSFNGRSGRRFGQPPPGSVDADEGRILARGDSPIGGEFAGPYGLVYPAQAFALWTRAYMDAHGVSEADMSSALEAVAVAARRGAASNPRAMLRDKPLTPADYRASPYLSEPLRVADLCIETDGACAVVIATEDAIRGPAVALLGVTQSISDGYDDAFLRAGDLPPRIPEGLIPRWLGGMGVAVDQLEAICTYDACTANVVFDAEMIGLCARGEGHRWVRDPSIPFNPSGGHLAEAYLQGVNQIADAVRQVRAGVRYALVTSAGCGSAALLAAA